MEYLKVGDKLQHTSGHIFTVTNVTVELYPDRSFRDVGVTVETTKDDGAISTVSSEFIARAFHSGAFKKIADA